MDFTKRLALLALTLSVVAVGSGALRAQPAQTVARAAKTTAAATAQRASKTSAKASSKTAPRPVSSSSGYAANTVMTPEVFEQRVASLADKLLYDCLRPRCAGDVPYSNCFNKDEEVDSILRSDQTCTSLLNKETQEVRDEARRRVNDNLDKRYEEACKNAGGQFKSVERTCQVKITFAANRQDGKELIAKGVHWRAFDIGRSMTCSTSTFSVSDNDMFYRPDKTIEQEISTINAVVGLGTNVISGAMSGFAWHKANKELKKAETGIRDAVFTFNDSGLTYKGQCGTWIHGEKDKDCKGDNKTTDAQGNCYLREGSPDPNVAKACGQTSTSIYEKMDESIDGNIKPCGSISAEIWHRDKVGSCWVRITFANKTAQAAEQNRLIRTFGIMEASKAKDAQRERLNQISQQIMLAAAMQEAQGKFGGGERKRTTQVVSNIADANLLARQGFTCGFNVLNQYGNVRTDPNNTIIVCEKYEDGGKVDEKYFTPVANDDCKKADLGGSCSPFDLRMAAAFGLMNQKDSNVGTYAAALNAYQDAQNTINRESERVKNLQQDVEDAKKGVQDSVTAIGGNVLEMWVTDMTYQATRELGNGHCYIWANDSKTWYPFIKEGQSRRIGWSNF